MFEKSKEAEFLEKKFGEYYQKHKITLESVETREFGYGVMGRKIANRNLNFLNETEMNQFLRNQKPLFFSYSNAYYKFPNRRPMVNKELIKADIIYEFDADDLSNVIELNGYQWFSKENVDDTKKEIFRLIELLEKDFSFSQDGLAINFSGKAGYHLHLRGEEIQSLNKQARIELVDYLTGSGIYFDNLGYNLDTLTISKGVGKWKERINAGLVEFFDKDKKEISAITDTPVAKLKNLLKSKEDLLKSLNKGYLFPLSPRKSKGFWNAVLEDVVKTQMIPIDRQTSIDMHKIIRVPQTLHGTTGFLAKTLSVDELKTFDPHKEAIVFGDEMVRLFIKKAPQFSLKGKSFGPFEEEEVDLPLYAGIYLLGKGAKLV
jgi:DNA primase small subunit